MFPRDGPEPQQSTDAPAILLNHEFGNSFSKMFLYTVAWAGNTAAN